MSDRGYYQPGPDVKAQELVVDMLVAAVVRTFLAVLGLVLMLITRGIGSAKREPLVRIPRFT
jgi:hypothetical protein